MQSQARVILRALTQTMLILCFVLPVSVCFLAGQRRWKNRLISLFYRLNLFFWGIRLVVEGKKETESPLMVVANHSTYLDIVVLGSQTPVSFTAKKEIEGWPVIGQLAVLCDVIFIERKANKTGLYRDMLRRELETGRIIGLFPEGTTSPGDRILPFKSSFFSLAEEEVAGQPVRVQPVTIAYTHLNGLPIGPAWRPYVGWYGDVDFFPHIWTLLSLGNLTVKLHFHEPVTCAQFGSRKALAEHCQRTIAAQLERSLHSRP